MRIIINLFLVSREQDMFNIKDLNKFELVLLCRQEGFENIIPYIKSLTEENYKYEITEILQSCLDSNDPEGEWPQWYYLSQIKMDEKPTVRNVYYYPGYCFQRKFCEIWNLGFEFRFARRTSIRTFLYSCYRRSKEFQLNISADLCAHILSFLLPQQLGIEIKTKSRNEKITKKKCYLITTYRMNHCRVGHTTNLYNSCPHCAKLETEYISITRKLNMSLEMDGLPAIYQQEDELDMSLPRRKLEMDLMKIKHKIKLERLNQRAYLRQYKFQNC